MYQNQSDRLGYDFADPQPPKPLIGVPLPFSRYVCEFMPREVSHGTWIIRHRDSSERAYLSASYRDRHSFELVWRTSTTLCDGAAEFKNVVTA